MSVKVRKISGDTWGIVVHFQGKRWKQSVGSKKAADIMAAEVGLELARGKVGLAPAEIPTVANYSKTWLEYIELLRAPKTYTRYCVLVGKINTYIGKKRIDLVTRGDIRDLLLKEYKKGYAKGSIEILHSVLSGIFNYAIDDDLIMASPAVRAMKRLDLSSAEEEIKPLAHEEMADALAAIDGEVYPVIRLMFETGCRVGDALALTWGDLDFRNQKITICKTAKDQTVRQTTKTKIRRTIDMSDSLLSMLVELKKADKVLCFAQGIQQGPVFHKQGLLISDNTLRRKWDTACGKIGIGHRRLHDIRHTTASLLLARGAPITYVAEQLGHSSPQITLTTYAHYIPSENRGLVNLLRTGADTRCAGGAFGGQKQQKVKN